jgi:hypothetical protein
MGDLFVGEDIDLRFRRITIPFFVSTGSMKVAAYPLKLLLSIKTFYIFN